MEKELQELKEAFYNAIGAAKDGFLDYQKSLYTDFSHKYLHCPVASYTTKLDNTKDLNYSVLTPFIRHNYREIWDLVIEKSYLKKNLIVYTNPNLIIKDDDIERLILEKLNINPALSEEIITVNTSPVPITTSVNALLSCDLIDKEYKSRIVHEALAFKLYIPTTTNLHLIISKP